MREYEETVHLLEKLLGVTNQFDYAYLKATRTGGESSFTGEEYDNLNTVMVEVEEFLEGK